MFFAAVLLVVGIALVLLGADKLTDGATGLARRFDVPEMVIGLTVVAFGTSLPEFVTSFTSVLKGSSGLSIGNIVGSNTFNALMIVGCSALASPLVVSKSTVRKDIPFAILATLILIVVSSDAALDGGRFANLISRADGLTLVGFFAVFMSYTFSMAREKGSADGQPQAPRAAPMSYGRIFLYIVCGLAGLVFGGSLFVDAATEIALGLGVSETVVGLTLVAAGTSLPELATSIVAARKGSSAIAIGNVVGSNIFNVFFVTGFCAAVSPMSAGSLSCPDLGFMLLSILMLWCFSCTKRTVERWEGGVLVAAYLVYVAYLIRQA